VGPARVDGALLHLPLVLGLGHIAGARGDLQGPPKRPQGVVEPHPGALALQARREPGGMDECLGGALEKVKCMEETAVAGVLALRVGQLERAQTAMTFQPGEAGECARGSALGHGAAMAPVALAVDARGGFETEERALLGDHRTHAGEGLPHPGAAPHKALLGQALT
jgi:hypothetical protein